MMGKFNILNIQSIILVSIFLLLSSCVPKATEKKANCGSGQSFNSVTRECVSTQKSRSLPVATSSAYTFIEKQIQDYQLSYTDKDSDLAVSCKVIDGDNKIEVFSPKMAETYTEAKKLVDYLVMANTVHNAQAPGGSHLVTINSQLLDLQNDVTLVQASFSINDIIPAYEDLLQKASESYNLMKAYTSTSSLVYFNNLVRDQLLVARPYLEGAVNRCYCDGAGICKTRGGVIASSSGTASFNYYVTDALDGASITKQVTVTINNVNKAPYAANLFVDHTESNSSTPVATGNFTHPDGHDPDGNPLTFIKVTNPSSGSVICSSSTCNYTPTSGNTNTTTAKVYGSIDFYGVSFTALHYGTWINDLIFTFKNYNSSDERFLESGPFIKINYPNIDFYVPENYSLTPSSFAALINAHPYLQLLGTATAPGATQTVGTLPVSFNVASLGGVSGSGGFDSFTYKYRDSNGVDSNIATIIVDMVPANDPPTPVFLVSAPVPVIARNTSDATNTTMSTVNLFDGVLNFYTDPDTTDNLATSCRVSAYPFDPTTAAVLDETGASDIAFKAVLGTCSCTLAGQCSFDITSKYRNSPGSVLVYYAFQDSANWSTSYQSMQVSISPLNVAPSFDVATVDNSVDEDDDWSELIRVPVWANDRVVSDSEVQPSASTRQDLQYLMHISGETNSNIYNTADRTQSFRAKVLTCTTNCSTGCDAGSALTLSTGFNSLIDPNDDNYITLGVGSSSGVTKCLKIDYRPASMPEQSGSFDLTLKLKDVPKTLSEGSLTSADLVNTITVNNINDKPYVLGFSSTGSGEVVLATLDTAENSQALSQSFIVDEGGDFAEDDDEVVVDTLSTDNATLLPLSRVELIFDRDGDGLYENPGNSSVVSNEVFNGSEALPIELEPAADDQNAQEIPGNLVGRRLLFKVNPTPGNFGVANIRFTLQDNGSGAPSSVKTYVVSVVVHPVSTTHGGWTHLAAQGIKLTKKNTSLTQAFNCLNGASQSGTGSPNGVKISNATDKSDIYYDTTFKNCYYSTAVGTTNNWFSLNTYCPMSKKCKSGNSKTCLFATGDADLLTIEDTLGENEVYGIVDSSHEVTCYRIDNQTGVAYTPSDVTLSWKAFQVITSSPTITPSHDSYKIFRRKLNEEYDLTKPLATISQSELSYTDSTAYGGRAYYYKVVPVVSFNSKTINVFPTENFSEVRMVAPPANYSFVHRWMGNQEVCNKMGYTVNMAAPNRVDPTNNYRCPYHGPGESSGYYDIGTDYLVDSFESGCPFTEEPHCVVNGSNAACVGLAAPQENADVVHGDIYYRRSTGQCFAYDNNVIGGNWVEFKDLAANPGDFNGGTAGNGKSGIGVKTTSNFNPPVSNITRTDANSFCSMRGVVNIYTNGGATQSTGGFTIPNRKEQIAFSASPLEKQSSNKSYNEYADNTIQTIEDGQTLNTYAYCNSNYASGLESNFIDSDYPPSSMIYTLPGNASSSIRSLVTGSVSWGSNFKGTTMCVSRYGLQDIYGNVSEWVSDTFAWSGTNHIESTGIDLQIDPDGLGIDTNYAFNYQIGPCNNSNDAVPNICNSADTVETGSWDIVDREFGASYLALPVGLPFTDYFVSTYTSSPILTSLLRIGQTSGGISSAALHGDKFIVNDDRPNQVSGASVSMSTGGNYTSGNAAGRYSFELHPASYKDEKIGFRCRAVVNY